MKITYMRLCEDFDRINKETLNSFYTNSDKETDLFVYPELNAIIVRNPSKKVKKFIYTEYSVSGSIFKRIAVWCYIRLLLNSFGLLASSRIRQKGDIGSSVLLYPCNKKYRIFDFASNTVTVLTKSGFPNSAIKEEIDFRNNHKVDFILPLKNFKENQYTEEIIDGMPLARIKNDKEQYIETANKIWREYASKYDKEISPKEYCDIINKSLSEKLEILKSNIEDGAITKLQDTIKELCLKIILFDSSITITLSHGDLQPGNIWIENITDKVYIIDWETAKLRSVWYDEFLLYEGLRMPGGLNKLFELKPSLRKYVVILEELLYRLDDACCLPNDIRGKTLDGISNDFDVSNIK
ncbi:MAG: hypothetical protein E7561_03215 [Ruminococcaceae bacterium]|nr:hypothetical protein [Oscillospiraceae bacterium]